MRVAGSKLAEGGELGEKGEGEEEEEEEEERRRRASMRDRDVGTTNVITRRQSGEVHAKSGELGEGRWSVSGMRREGWDARQVRNGYRWAIGDGLAVVLVVALGRGVVQRVAVDPFFWSLVCAVARFVLIALFHIIVLVVLCLVVVIVVFDIVIPVVVPGVGLALEILTNGSWCLTTNLHSDH